MNRQVDDPTIVVRGDVPGAMVAYANEKVRAVAASTAVPVLHTEVRLDHHSDPARERPNHVELTLDLDGKPVRAHRNAPTMVEAIDGAVARLRRRLEAATERPQSLQFRHRDPSAWHHDDRPTERPHFYPRPIEERALVRHKSFALRPESIEEALFDLETLDHDFFLFVHDDTKDEALVYRVDGGYGIMQRAPTPDAIARVELVLQVGSAPAVMPVQDALTLLDESGAGFVFFVDATSDRGNVVYRRYDGNYGLIVPA